MTRIEITWPDEGTERVRAARGRLEQAAHALRAMSFEERLQVGRRVVESWTLPDAPWRRDLVAGWAADSTLHEETLREGLESALAAWDADRFTECARRELEAESRLLSPFDWTAIVAGGGVPMPTMLNALIPLVLGSPVLMREASNDHVTGAWLRRCLDAIDERFGRAFESLGFASTDTALDVLLEAPCVVATGSDETIRSIESRLGPQQRFVAFGHQFSIVVLGPGLAHDAARSNEAARGIALDVARWDQMGCLSPVVVYLVDFDSKDASEVTRQVANALEEISKRMPRGELEMSVSASHATERAEARMRASSDRGLLVEGADFTLVLEADAQPRPAPLHRFLRLMPVESVESLERELRPFDGHLSNVASVGFEADDAAEIQSRLSRFGVSRWTGPGRMQTPPIDWPHDGRPVFTPFARFTQRD